jgi:hypothetical protein
MVRYGGRFRQRSARLTVDLYGNTSLSQVPGVGDVDSGNRPRTGGVAYIRSGTDGNTVAVLVHDGQAVYDDCRDHLCLIILTFFLKLAR